jgi:hypothetical protein
VLEEIAYLLGDPRTDNEQLRDPVSQERLADALATPRGTLRGWLDGSEPRHNDGERIIVFWCRLTGKARTFLPVDRYVYSAAKAGAPAPIRTTDKPKAAGDVLHAVCMRWAI